MYISSKDKRASGLGQCIKQINEAMRGYEMQDATSSYKIDQDTLD